MTSEQFKQEKAYQAAMFIARRMLESGCIDAQDFSKIQTDFITKFQPLFAPILR